MDENHTTHPDSLIAELESLASVHDETTGTRRSYACERMIVRREDGSLWALEWNQNELHSYATDAYPVEAREVTVTKYERSEVPPAAPARDPSILAEVLAERESQDAEHGPPGDMPSLVVALMDKPPPACLRSSA